MIGLGTIVITVCDLGHHSLAAAAPMFLCQQPCDFQPVCCVSAAVVPGLDRSKKRRERVKHRVGLTFFPVLRSNVAIAHFPMYRSA